MPGARCSSSADTDVAMLNALIHTVIDEGLVDQDFIARARQQLRSAAAKTCRATAPRRWRRSAASRRRRCARWRARSPQAKGAMILWGMGVSQHVHGTDNARCLIALATVTGQIGKPGSGLHPLRGQNNVQGASDAGLIPMMFPNYQRVRQRRRACLVRELLGHAAGRPAGLHRGRNHAQGAGARRATRTRCAACTSWARTRP